MPSLSLPSRRLTAAITAARQAGAPALHCQLAQSQLPTTPLLLFLGGADGPARFTSACLFTVPAATVRGALHEQPDAVALSAGHRSCTCRWVLSWEVKAYAVEQDLDLAQELELRFLMSYVHALPARRRSPRSPARSSWPSIIKRRPLGLVRCMPTAPEASATKHTEYGLPLTVVDLLHDRPKRRAN